MATKVIVPAAVYRFAGYKIVQGKYVKVLN